MGEGCMGVGKKLHWVTFLRSRERGSILLNHGQPALA